MTENDQRIRDIIGWFRWTDRDLYADAIEQLRDERDALRRRAEQANATFDLLAAEAADRLGTEPWEIVADALSRGGNV